MDDERVAKRRYQYEKYFRYSQESGMVCNLLLAVLVVFVTTVGATNDVDLSFTLTVHSNGRPNEACTSAEIDQVERHLVDILNGLSPSQLGISNSPYASFQVTSLELDSFFVSPAPDRNRRLSSEENIVYSDEVSSVSGPPLNDRRRLYGYWFFGGRGRCSCCYCENGNRDQDHYLRRGLGAYSQWYSGTMNHLGYGYNSGSSSGGDGSSFDSAGPINSISVGSKSSTGNGDGPLSIETQGASLAVTHISTVKTEHSSSTNTRIEDGVLSTSSSVSASVTITLAADLENELGTGHCMAGDTYTITIDYHD